MSLPDGSATWGKEGAAALVAAQLAAGDVEKRSYNAQKAYKYSSQEDMIAAAEVLAQAALSLSPESSGLTSFMMPGYVDGDGVVQPEEGVIMLRSTFRLEHGPTGQLRLIPFECPVLPHKGMPLDKALAAARTYSLGYLLRDLLLLSRVEAGTDVDQRPDPPRRETPRAAPRQAPAARPPEDAPSSASELHFRAAFEEARDMAGLDAVKAQVLAAFPSGIGRTRLAAVYTARRRALEAPPADWGDRAILLGRHIEDARGLDALGVARRSPEADHAAQ